jgi:acetyl-CoA/propionyl-CoA carboxylase biotin carboxyl carrier protein
MTEELRPSQAAARIGATTRSVQRWIATGRLPARRVGGRWLVASDVIDAFVVAGAPEAVPAEALQRPIRTVFIANRGEIAARVARTCARLGIRAAAPATDGPDAIDLLDGPAVVRAAVAAGADAVHPGFGFLAENADFAEDVEAAGMRWIGPPPAAIRAMGDKAAARRLAGSLGVPVLAGYDGPDQADAALIAAAGRIGFPLLVKPSAGGGGKGMRVVRAPERLAGALAASRREADAAFGDDRLILERLVEGGRHIEIQVLFDAFGAGVHLGERDCSIQRRHQKVLEEAPSPAVDAALRERLGNAALALARAVGYVSAGTCEFLVDDRGGTAFLEMNTRLQVEHPVTELVTGRDLVAEQLRIAAGEPLGFGQAEADRRSGHAVEVRLYAEDAEDGFLPAQGRVEALRWPAGDGIRVDAGIALGDVIGGRFDPMLAKVVAWGPDRSAAFDRLTRALDETVVLGLVTNLRFLRWLVRQPAVLDGQARTDTLERIWPPDDWTDRVAIPDDAWSAAAHALAEGSSASADPWAGGWRMNAAPRVWVEADGEVQSVSLAPAPPEPVALVRLDGAVHLDVAGRSTAFRLAPAPDVDAAARAAGARHASNAAGAGGAGGVAGAGPGAGGPVALRAPMPGAIVAIHASLGQAVETGDPIVTLEAMKMEHVVAAPRPGRLAEVHVGPADQVTRGQVLAIIDP